MPEPTLKLRRFCESIRDDHGGLGQKRSQGINDANCSDALDWGTEGHTLDTALLILAITLACLRGNVSPVPIAPSV